ncbi:MAG TPA: hypothetical protein VFH80_23725 [Solirubrobacteraceae bacterium]|nr:hypothetical protein [Solirubrobacteraceae bacterium]
MRLRFLILLAAIGLLVPAAAARADGGETLSLSQVSPGMDCTGETVVQGTTITSFDVHVISVVQAPGEGARILVSVSGPAVDSTGVAEGFSGSPVYCPDGLGGQGNIGAISEGIGQYGNNVVLVTPIDQMLGEPVTPPSDAPRLAVRPRPLSGPLTVGGLSPAVFGVLQRAATQAGWVVLAAPTPGANTLGFPVQSLVPGASVAASYSSGAIPMGAIGTVTYVNGRTVYAFGHELDGAGRRSLLLQDAYVYFVVNNPDPNTAPSYKLASPGHTLGTLTSDTPNAVIGQLGSPPPSVPVDVTVRDLDTGHSLALDTQVADETDVGLPLGASQVDVIAPLEVAQAATQIYDGPPANESGRMCLQIFLRGVRAPLGFCNRYVGTGAAGDELVPPEVANAASTDVASAFSALERVDFAALHVQRVAAHLDAQRGLAAGSIVGARAPRRVRAGQLVKVRLKVRIYRGGLQTFGFRVRIPHGASGRIALTIRGPELPPSTGSSTQGLAGALSSLLAFSSSSGPPPSLNEISSLSELRDEVAALATYDGLYASFSGRAMRPVYRNRSLLITGRATLPFVVGG